jgi:hypothetical protein
VDPQDPGPCARVGSLNDVGFEQSLVDLNRVARFRKSSAPQGHCHHCHARPIQGSAADLRVGIATPGISRKLLIMALLSAVASNFATRSAPCSRDSLCVLPRPQARVGTPPAGGLPRLKNRICKFNMLSGCLGAPKGNRTPVSALRGLSSKSEFTAGVVVRGPRGVRLSSLDASRIRLLARAFLRMRGQFYFTSAARYPRQRTRSLFARILQASTPSRDCLLKDSVCEAPPRIRLPNARTRAATDLLRRRMPDITPGAGSRILIDFQRLSGSGGPLHRSTHYS